MPGVRLDQLHGLTISAQRSIRRRRIKRVVLLFLLRMLRPLRGPRTLRSPHPRLDGALYAVQPWHGGFGAFEQAGVGYVDQDSSAAGGLGRRIGLYSFGYLLRLGGRAGTRHTRDGEQVVGSRGYPAETLVNFPEGCIDIE